MSRIMRSVKNVTKGYTSAQIRVREATSNDPSLPTKNQMTEIAQWTFNSSTEFYDIVDMVDKRLNDTGQNWRHVLKALILTDFLLHQGSELVVTWSRQNIYIFKTLREFQFIEDGVDFGSSVRVTAQKLVAFILDEERVRKERYDHSWEVIMPNIGLLDGKPRDSPVELLLNKYQQELQEREYSMQRAKTSYNHTGGYEAAPAPGPSFAFHTPEDAVAARVKNSENDIPAYEEATAQGPSTMLYTAGNSMTPRAPSPVNAPAPGWHPNMIVHKVEAARQLAKQRQEEEWWEQDSPTTPATVVGTSAHYPFSITQRDEMIPPRETSSASPRIGSNQPQAPEPPIVSRPNAPRPSPSSENQPQTPVTSPRYNRQVPDLVRDSKLETVFIDRNITQHTHYVSDRRTRQRRVRKEAKWTLVREVAAGSFGRVWLQECTEGDDIGKLRAVKEIGRGEGERPDIDYRRELEAIAKFSHEKYVHCFVKSFGWYESNSAVFIAMEYFEKGDLQSYLKKPFPEAEAREISFQVLEGLSFMHDNGFAHRDLKPGNILVSNPSPKWWVKISDFGISKRAEEEQTAFRTLVGTKGYLAPEVIGIYSPDDVNTEEEEHDDSYTDVVDIWALGAIAFRMLTNRSVFSEPRRLYNYVVLKQPFPDKLLIDAGVTEACRDLLAMLMASSPRKRPSAETALSHPWMLASDLPTQPSDSAISSEQAEDLQDEGYNTAPTASWSAVLTQATQPNRAPATHVQGTEASASWPTYTQ